MTDEDMIDHMVSRFLTWKLPDDFNPDGGISFQRDYNQNTPWPSKHEPVGTNLLDARQAKAMVLHMMEGLPTPPAMNASVTEAMVEALREARDFIIGLGQNSDAEGWPRDPYVVCAKIEVTLTAALASLSREPVPAPSVPHDVAGLVERGLDAWAVATGAYNPWSRGYWPEDKEAARKGVEAVIAALRQAPAIPAWQPIETAPNDGTEFIAIEQGDIYKCAWLEDEPDEGPVRAGWWDFVNQSFENPSGWMPLPARPSTTAKEG